MRQANFFYQGSGDERGGPVAHGVAHGLRDTLALPDRQDMPDRLRELADLLVERNALGRSEARRAVDAAAEPTRLVLVVEDDPAIRDLAVELLEETALDVVACATGEEAVALLTQQGDAIAMVFTDVRLAGAMDSVELAQTVGGQWPGIRLVVTYGQASPRQDCLPSDAVYLPKPWRALDVLVQVDHAVRHPDCPAQSQQHGAPRRQMLSAKCKSKFDALSPTQKQKIIEAAYEQELVWINVAKLYEFAGDDGRKLRDYIRDHYIADARSIQP